MNFSQSTRANQLHTHAKHYCKSNRHDRSFHMFSVASTASHWAEICLSFLSFSAWYANMLPPTSDGCIVHSLYFVTNTVETPVRTTRIVIYKICYSSVLQINCIRQTLVLYCLILSKKNISLMPETHFHQS